MDFNRDWETPPAFKSDGAFAMLAIDLLDPESQLARTYPHLHRVLRDRLDWALAARGGVPLSQCDHTGFNGHELGRSDGVVFQHEEDSELVSFLTYANANDTTTLRLESLCGKISDRMEIYGVLGQGTFASVFLARERPTSSSLAEQTECRDFAMKVEDHTTLRGSATKGHRPEMAPFKDIQDYTRYIPDEALVLLFCANSDRFPKLDAVYVHDQFHTISMSAIVDDTPDRNPVPSGDWKRMFPPFTGRYLMEKNHTPVLNEMQACKVASQLLQALFHLADMNIWHADLSVNNYVVDEQLNVALIDLGSFLFNVRATDFFYNRYTYLPSQENFMSPEMAQELLRPKYAKEDWTRQGSVRMPHDQRQVTMWKFAVIVYGILHGFWPWDKPGQYDWDLLGYQGDASEERVLHRRLNMIYNDVPINENLSQDCKDVLSAMLSRNPTERPSLEALGGYPWFQQWVHEDGTFARPYSAAYEEHWSHSATEPAQARPMQRPNTDPERPVYQVEPWRFSRYPIDDSRRWREYVGHR